MKNSDLDRVRQRYHDFAEFECRAYSPIYFRLARIVASDEQILEFVENQPCIQPNLFFASIQFVTGRGSIPASAPALRKLLGEKGEEIAALMRTRRTQTNEVGRCAVILPALPSGPLALVEVGASAGLCLLLDRFSYEYAGRGHLGSSLSRVSLTCSAMGNVVLPKQIPDIAWRRGLDLYPLNVHDQDDMRWLRACIWPDHEDRLVRLDSAIEIARSDPPKVIQGDLVADLSAILDQAPSECTLVVFHSAVLYYVDLEARKSFADGLSEASKRREIVWISNESQGVVTRVPQDNEKLAVSFCLRRTTLRDEQGIHETLAVVHPHGSSMIWL